MFPQLVTLLLSVYIISIVVTIHYLKSGWTNSTTLYDLMFYVYCDQETRLLYQTCFRPYHVFTLKPEKLTFNEEVCI